MSIQTGHDGVLRAEPTDPTLLTVGGVAERLHCSIRTIHELTRTRAIPHWKRPNVRRVLFPIDWLVEWEYGADLDVLELGDGGRIVKPRTKKAA